MSYIVNDAIEELLDIVADLIWGRESGQAGSNIKRPSLSVVNMPQSLGVGANVDQFITTLTEDERRRLEIKIAIRRRGGSLGTIRRMGPQLTVASALKLDNLRSDGLLGRLVAQYWVGARARAWYQLRCGAYCWDDDTPVWKHRNNATLTKSELDKALKNPEWYGVGLYIPNYVDRWPDSKIHRIWGKRYFRRYSLESTFSNWSAPVFTQWAMNNSGSPKEGKGRWPGKKVKGYGETFAEAPHNFADFCDGRIKFGELMAGATGVGVMSEWKQYGEWQSDVYSEVGWSRRTKLYAVPWRMFNGVSYADRIAASYKFVPVLGSVDRTKRECMRYYDYGYNLVRTVLDVLCARGETADQFEGFSEHCTWWMIAPPIAEFVAKYPDLSAIGGGVVGLGDVSSAELVRYVMSITPKPGTVPPWEDKGPLWTWPSSTGHMAPIGFYPGAEKRNGNSWWGTFSQYVLSVETSICSNALSGVVNAAVDTIVDVAMAAASEWVAAGVAEVLDMLETEIGGAAWDAARDVIKDVSVGAANISRFLDAEKLVGQLESAVNLPRALGKYLDLEVDGVSSQLASAKIDAIAAADAVRKSWDWADDLIGGASSFGKQANGAISKYVGTR